jgi:hypothetical protein
MTNLEKLENQIRKALPELMELTEGCEIRLKGNFYDFTYIGNIGDESEEVFMIDNNKEPMVVDTEWFEKEGKHIIGHPVTILHLLRWLDSLDGNCYYLSMFGHLEHITEGRFSEVPIYCLDLAKHLLRDQPEEVINELVKLIPEELNKL